MSSQGDEIWIDVDGTCEACSKLPMNTLLKIVSTLQIDAASSMKKDVLCVQISERLAELKTNSSCAPDSVLAMGMLVTKEGRELKKNVEITLDTAKKLQAIDVDTLVKSASRVKLPKKQKTAYKKIMKWLLRSTKVLAGTVGTVVSFGAGGDTIPDLLFTVADAGFLAKNIADVIRLKPSEEGAKKWVNDIYNLQWTGDPDLVREKMEALFEEVEKNEKAAEIYQIVCEKYLSVLDSFAALFGSLVSTMIPDDAGAARIVIEMIIAEGASYAGKGPFEALKGIYNKLPDRAKTTLSSREDMKEFLVAIVEGLQKMLPQKGDTAWERTKKHIKRSGVLGVATALVPFAVLAAPAIAAGNMAVEYQGYADKLSGWIDNQVVPNIDPYVDLMMRVLPMAFAVTLIFARCNK